MNNSGHKHQGNKLKVTQDMVGDNQWTCIATNVIETKTYQAMTQISFKAGECEFLIYHSNQIIRYQWSQLPL